MAQNTTYTTPSGATVVLDENQNVVSSTPATNTNPPAITPSAAQQPTYALGNGQGSIIPTAQQTSQIENPTPATDLTPTPAPALPTLTAPTAQQNYFDSVSGQATTAESNLEGTLGGLESGTESGIAADKTQETQIEGEEATLSQPFEAAYEASQSQALGINSDFDADNNLADELNDIVNQANSLLSGNTGRFASNNTLTSGYNATISALTARAGLIQSAMAAYNSNIGQAQTMIQNAVTAMTADNNDQLNYYNTLLTLNQNDQLQLTDEQTSYINDQISDLQGQVTSTQTNANAILQGMLNPSTAQAYAQSGVTLADDPQTVATKLGNYAYSQELSTQSQNMAASGWTPVIAGQKAPAGASVVTLTDSRGNTQSYYNATTGKVIGSSSSGYYYVMPDGALQPLTSPTAGQPAAFKFSSTQTTALLGAGVPETAIPQIQTYIQQYGVQALFQNSDLTASQKTAINGIFGTNY